ncbi:MAG: hypothetical protein WC997_18275 [Porticoccaceae bacterium]
MTVKRITETFERLRGGEMLDEASERLAEVVRAVDATGKAGEITIKLQVKKLSRSGALEIIDRVTAKVPEEPQLTTMMYPTPEGNLITEDPRQQKLDLKVPQITGATDVQLKSVKLPDGTQVDLTTRKKPAGAQHA